MGDCSTQILCCLDSTVALNIALPHSSQDPSQWLEGRCLLGTRQRSWACPGAFPSEDLQGLIPYLPGALQGARKDALPVESCLSVSRLTKKSVCRLVSWVCRSRLLLVLFVCLDAPAAERGCLHCQRPRLQGADHGLWGQQSKT